MKWLQYGSAGVLGYLLSVGGIHTTDWLFWGILFCVAVIQITARLEGVNK